MRGFASTGALVAALLALGGCSKETSTPGPADSSAAAAPRAGCCDHAGADHAASSAFRSGSPQRVAFAVAWASDPDPAKAARTAVVEAIGNLGCPAVGMIFCQHFARTVLDADGSERQLPDTERERAVLPALRSLAGGVPVIGFRAVPLATDGAMPANAVAVLAIGGRKVACKVAKAELGDDRLAVGRAVAEQLRDVDDLKLVVALSATPPSIEAMEVVSADDFVRGLLEAAGEGVTLFGGHALPNADPDDLGGVQFIDDEVVERGVVAMGIGGPIAAFVHHANEPAPSGETLATTVTALLDKAEGTRPLLALLSDGRTPEAGLREFVAAEQGIFRDAVTPAIRRRGAFPIYGFLAWGKPGPFAGTLGDPGRPSEQHAFVGVVLAEKADD